MSEDTKTPWWRDGLLFFSKVSGWVVAPVLVALVLGKFLDRRFNTEPWIFFSMTAVAFTISLFGLVKESSAYMKTIAPQTDDNTHGTPFGNDN